MKAVCDGCQGPPARLNRQLQEGGFEQAQRNVDELMQKAFQVDGSPSGSERSGCCRGSQKQL